jgi:hypothetical protein
MGGWFPSWWRELGAPHGRRAARDGRALIGVIALAALSVSGCGYSLAGHGSYLPTTIRTVGIPTFENGTAQQRVEQTLTEQVRSAFIGRGKYRVINEEAGADAVLRARIVGFTLQPSGLNQQQLTSRYLVTITLKVSFVDLKNPDMPLWSNDALTFRDEYDLGTSNVNGGTLVDQSPNVVARIAEDASRTIVTAIFEAF